MVARFYVYATLSGEPLWILLIIFRRGGVAPPEKYWRNPNGMQNPNGSRNPNGRRNASPTINFQIVLYITSDERVTRFTQVSKFPILETPCGSYYL